MDSFTIYHSIVATLYVIYVLIIYISHYLFVYIIGIYLISSISTIIWNKLEKKGEFIRFFIRFGVTDYY